MYDFDVVFLLIAPPSSSRVGDMLALHQYLAGSGVGTTVATSPDDLSLFSKRLRILVIDGEGDCDFDVYAVISAMRDLHNVAIVFLADDALLTGERGLYAGADICLPGQIAPQELLRSIIALTGDQQPGVAQDDRAPTRRKRRPKRNYLGLRLRSRFSR